MQHYTRRPSGPKLQSDHLYKADKGFLSAVDKISNTHTHRHSRLSQRGIMLLILSSIRLLVFGSNQDVEPKRRQEGGDERTGLLVTSWLCSVDVFECVNVSLRRGQNSKA